MRIAHFAPLAPHRCGLYETTRDVIVAERLVGLTADLVDIGVSGEARRVGEVDCRGAHEVRALDYADVRNYDLYVCHGGIPEWFLRQTQAPVVQMLHGRPESSFRLTQSTTQPVYDLHARRAQDSRWPLFITLWNEHLPYWRAIVPQEKLVSTGNPPCDLSQYGLDGPRHVFLPRDAVHVLVGDVWRPDADPYHILHALALVAQRVPALRVHFYGCRQPMGPWSHLLGYLRRLGVLGEVKGMMLGFDAVLRGADVVATMHNIATRILRESLACGTPIVAAAPCRYTEYQAIPEDPDAYAAEVVRCIAERPPSSRVVQDAAPFALPGFGARLKRMYERVLVGELA